jgi:hypothetical protein
MNVLAIIVLLTTAMNLTKKKKDVSSTSSTQTDTVILTDSTSDYDDYQSYLNTLLNSDSETNLGGYTGSVTTGCVKVFKDCSWSGDSAEICGDTTSISSKLGSTWNDKISSLAFGSTKAYVYKDANYSGSSAYFYSDVRCLTTYNFNDMISSMKVYPGSGCIRVFEDCYYSGSYKQFCSGVADLDTWKSKISSIRVAKNTKVTLYTWTNFLGPNYESYTSDQECLTTYNDKALSLRIGSAS